MLWSILVELGLVQVSLVQCDVVWFDTVESSAVAYLGPWVVPGVRWVDVHLAEEVHVKATVEVCPLMAQPAPHQVEAVLVPPTGLAWPPVSPGQQEA